MRAYLYEQSWLGAVVHLEAGGQLLAIEYDGRGIGYESVYVNGRLAVETGGHLWFVPRFEFEHGPLRVAVEVRVWPWLTLRSFRLFVNDKEVTLERAPREFAWPVREVVLQPEAPFLRQLGANPRDDVTRAVYADWLEEAGDPERSEFLRLQLAIRGLPAESGERRAAQERLGVLRGRLDAAWLRMIDPLARLGLSGRAQRWAARLGVATVGYLCEWSAGDLIETRVSQAVFSELRHKLAEQGLRLRDE
jgi:uncharacterized protein (TIGR02996 family)